MPEVTEGSQAHLEPSLDSVDDTKPCWNSLVAFQLRDTAPYRVGKTGKVHYLQPLPYKNPQSYE